LSQSSKERPLRWLTGLGVFLFFCGSFSNVSLLHFLPNPDATRGYVYAVNDHGSPAYVTKPQFMIYQYSWTVIVAGIFFVVLGRKARGKNILGQWRD
jgi:hypothetical protein